MCASKGHTILATCSLLCQPPSPTQASPVLTGAGGHTAGTKGVATLRVGHGLEGISVVGDQGRAVQLTDTAMIEVEAGLAETDRWWSL